MEDKTLVEADPKVAQYLKEFQDGKMVVDRAIVDFPRLDTMANAQYDGGSKKNPNIGDTTVAGIVRQIVRTAIKKVPNARPRINGSSTTMEALICKHIIEDNILNPNTFGKGIVSTLQLGARGALTRGFNVFQVSSLKMYGEFGTIPKLIHYNDSVIEPGTQDGNLSTYFYIRTKYTPGKIESIYKRELKKGDASTYNLPALKALIETGPDGNGAADYAAFLTPQENSKVEAGAATYDIITRYSSDPEEPILTFSPSINQFLRTVENRSKFGYPRVLFLVIDPAELSPYGDSRVRLSSPNQNFLMLLRQNVGTTWMYNSKPALLQTGNFIGTAAIKSGVTIKSTDPNANAKFLNLDTSTAQQYPTISESIEKQIQVMMGMNPGQALGAIGGSKTGIGAQAQKAGIDDAIQQITTIIEEFLRQYVISALDIILSEQDGESMIFVSDAIREDIKRINPNAFPDKTNPNGLLVDWNKLYNYIKKIDVTLDTTMSKEEWSNEKRGDLQDAVTVMSQTANPNDPADAERKKIVEDKFIDETAPELSTALDNVQAPTPVMPQNNLTQ